ncbi:MAG: hypothetical protein ACOZQL_16030 [Myxococcota bacterium]
MSALLALVLTAGNPFLAEGLAHEKDLDFEKCVQRLQQASTQWKSTPAELREIELHLGLCTFNLGDRRAAAEHFRTALRIDESVDLPPYTSPRAVELFLEVKRALRAPPPPLPDEDLPPEDDAPKRAQLEPRPRPEPFSFPPALERRALPLSLAAVTLATAIAGLAFGVHARALAADANAARFEADFFRLGEVATGFAVASTVSWLVSGLAAVSTGVGWWVTNEPRASGERGR